jgi:hypothetical protein
MTASTGLAQPHRDKGQCEKTYHKVVKHFPPKIVV